MLIILFLRDNPAKCVNITQINVILSDVGLGDILYFELVNFILDYQLQNPDVLVVLTADHECGGVSVHDGENGELDIRFTSDYHSANFVPIWAIGPGANVFDAFMDNTEIGKQLMYYIEDR